MYASSMPRLSSISSASETSRFMCFSVGTTPAKQARFTPSPRTRMPGSCAASATTDGRSDGHSPSRRSPRSTISITSCTCPRSSAATDSLRSRAGSEFRLASVHSITCSTPDRGGRRINTKGDSIPASRIRRMFSRRESPMSATPPRSMARATAG